MEANITPWGNSLGLRLPKSYAKEMGLEKGSKVQITLEKDRIVIRPSGKESLKALVERITDDNVYGELDFGPPVGREAW